MSLKKQLKDFSDELPAVNSKIILFFPVQENKFPIATYFYGIYDLPRNLSYILVDNDLFERAWLYLNIRQLISDKSK